MFRHQRTDSFRIFCLQELTGTRETVSQVDPVNSKDAEIRQNVEEKAKVDKVHNMQTAFLLVAVTYLNVKGNLDILTQNGNKFANWLVLEKMMQFLPSSFSIPRCRTEDVYAQIRSSLLLELPFIDGRRFFFMLLGDRNVVNTKNMLVLLYDMFDVYTYTFERNRACKKFYQYYKQFLHLFACFMDGWNHQICLPDLLNPNIPVNLAKEQDGGFFTQKLNILRNAIRQHNKDITDPYVSRNIRTVRETMDYHKFFQMASVVFHMANPALQDKRNVGVLHYFNFILYYVKTTF